MLNRFLLVLVFIFALLPLKPSVALFVEPAKRSATSFHTISHLSHQTQLQAFVQIFFQPRIKQCHKVLLDAFKTLIHNLITSLRQQTYHYNKSYTRI